MSAQSVATSAAKLARQLAEKSDCPRADVGAVLVKGDRIIGRGHNQHLSPGTPCDMANGHCVAGIHAEMDALDNVHNPQDAVLYLFIRRNIGHGVKICPTCQDTLETLGIKEFHVEVARGDRRHTSGQGRRARPARTVSSV